MKKEVVFSMRMSKTVRDTLKKNAENEGRSVASLLDKIIGDYLRKKGLLANSYENKERRWFTRREIYKSAQVQFEKESDCEVFTIVVLDISMGGALLAIPKSFAPRFSTHKMPEFELLLELFSDDRPLSFGCKAKRIVESGFGFKVGVQFINTREEDLQMLKTYLN